ncbi:Protein of unknown function [Bacillus mobilis]|nr:Protein of unknown function [Bacillus mobilis]
MKKRQSWQNDIAID